MLKEQLGTLITEATKAQKETLPRTLKLIKTEFQKVEKSRSSDQPLTDAEEIKILGKMAEQRRNSISIYKEVGTEKSEKLAEVEAAELEIISQWIPDSPDLEKVLPEIIENYLKGKNGGYTLSIRDMKTVISLTQSQYPSLLSEDIVKLYRSKYI